MKQELVIPKSVHIIGENTFLDCEHITSVIFESDYINGLNTKTERNELLEYIGLSHLINSTKYTNKININDIQN